MDREKTIRDGRTAASFLRLYAADRFQVETVQFHVNKANVAANAIDALIELAEKPFSAPEPLPPAVTYEGTGPAWKYHIAEDSYRKCFDVPRHVNFRVLKACLADAERRDKEERGRPGRELAERIVRELFGEETSLNVGELVDRVAGMLGAEKG